jgi:putative tryptophan/tyrosine transport system substrate-binding protein
MQFDRMNRREFIGVLGGAAAAWPCTLVAQGTDRVRRIGMLTEIAATDPQARSNIAALQRRLRQLGWLEGSNLEIDYRWAPDDPVLVWKFAKELTELRPDLIVAHSSPVVTTLLGQTRNIPIVFVSISDPIGEGFVASFARPGGNVTGFTNFESSMTGKWVELLKEIAPEITRVAFLFNPQTTAGGGSYFLRPIDVAASTLKVKAVMALFTMTTRSKRLLLLLHASPVRAWFCSRISLPRLITNRSSLWQHVIVCQPFIAIVSWWSAVG